MRSRKEWRNRDAGDVDAVMALLEALRSGSQAEVVALVDDDRSVAGGAPPPNFWEPLDRGQCAEGFWEDWYRTLRAEERADAACVCGARHRLQGFLIHGRWALLMIPSVDVPADGIAAVTSCVRALADALPPGRSADEVAWSREGGDDEGARGDGHPLVWWVRPQRH